MTGEVEGNKRRSGMRGEQVKARKREVKVTSGGWGMKVTGR